MARHHWLTAALIALLTVAQPAAAVADSSHALSRSNFQVFTADMNGDGQADYLLKAIPAIVPLIDDDKVAVIQKAAPVATFMLLSNIDGSHILVLNPDSATMSSPVWSRSSAAPSYGIVKNNSTENMFIQSRVEGASSFLIGLSQSGTVQLRQELTRQFVGFDLGAAAVTTALSDTNGDGRADLVVRSNGRINVVLLADSNGIFYRDTQASVAAVWGGMLSELDRGNKEGALSYIHPHSRDSYGQMFSALGDAMASISPALTKLRFVTLQPDIAEAVITRNFGGQETMHYVTFMLSDNGWCVMEF